MPTNRTSDAAARGKGRPRAFDRGLALHRALEVFWQQGYAPASVASLCKAMKINPPSLYATFGNKAALFLEALRHYEQTYWEAPAQRFLTAPDIYAAVEDFFQEAAQILLSPETPCGCMVVLAAVNIAAALAGALNTLLEGLSLQARDGLFQSELKAIAAHAVRMLPPRLP